MLDIYSIIQFGINQRPKCNVMVNFSLLEVNLCCSTDENYIKADERNIA